MNSNLIRFVPSANYFTAASPSAAITVRPWDGTQGASGSYYSSVSSNAAANLNSFSDDTPVPGSFTASIWVQQSASVVYVNSTWSGSTQNHTVTDSEGHTHSFGIDAFSTIASAQAFVAANGTVDVDGGIVSNPLTYTEAVSITQSITLAGYGLSTPTITVPTSATNIPVVSVAASNVTVEGLHLIVDQPHAAAGVAAINDSFDGLQVLNNVIDTTGSGTA